MVRIRPMTYHNGSRLPIDGKLTRIMAGGKVAIVETPSLYGGRDESRTLRVLMSDLEFEAG